MSIWRIIPAAAFIIWLGFNLVLGFGASGLEKAVDEEEVNGVEQVAMTGSGWLAGKAIGMYASFKENQHVQTMFDPDALNARRAIEYTEVVSLPALLNDGEAEPEALYRLLYATARAPSYVGQECQRLTQSIASRCLVRDVKVRALREGGFKVTANVLFAPSAPIGEIRAVEGREPNYIMMRSNLDLYGGPVEVPAVNVHTGRDVFYQRSELYCAALRQAAGNCVLETIKFSYRDKGGEEGIVVVTARARFGMLSTMQAPEEDRMEPFIEALLKPHN